MSPPAPAPVSKSSLAGSLRTGLTLFGGQALTFLGMSPSSILLGLSILWALWRRRLLDLGGATGRVLLLPLGIYMAWSLAAMVMSVDPAVSLGEVKEAFSLAPVLLGIALLRDPRHARRLLNVLIWVAVGLALHGVWQFYATDYGDLNNRIRGPFAHYLTYAGVLMLGHLLLVGRLLCGRPHQGWRRRLAEISGLMIVSWALLLSLSRGSWVAIALSVVVALVLRAPRRLPLLVLLGGILLVTGPQTWRTRLVSITDLGDASNYDRLCMAEAGLYMIGERPIFGLGPEMVRQLYPIYRHPSAPRLTVAHLHNSYLQIAAERGLPCLAAYLWLLGAGLVMAWRGYRRQGPTGGDADLYFGPLLAILAFAIAGLFEANWSDSEVQRVFLVLLALPTGLTAGHLGQSAATEKAPGKAEQNSSADEH